MVEMASTSAADPANHPVSVSHVLLLPFHTAFVATSLHAQQTLAHELINPSTQDYNVKVWVTLTFLFLVSFTAGAFILGIACGIDLERGQNQFQQQQQPTAPATLLVHSPPYPRYPRRFRRRSN